MPYPNPSAGPASEAMPRAVRRVAAAADTPRERWQRWRRRAATTAMLLLALAMGYGVVFGHNGLISFEQKRAESQDLARQMERLQQENQRLEVHVQRLENDPDAIEHQAREELHYTRAGEVIYTLPTTLPATLPTQDRPTPEKPAQDKPAQDKPGTAR